jgi:uncharacterized membrane protein YjjP (DUF1212 family)
MLKSSKSDIDSQQINEFEHSYSSVNSHVMYGVLCRIGVLFYGGIGVCVCVCLFGGVCGGDRDNLYVLLVSHSGVMTHGHK